MSVITKEEWKKVEEQLKSFYKIVNMKCDEYEVSLKLVRLSQFKNVIAVYVNGVVQGKWLLEDCEERRRFFCPKNQSVYSQKQKANMKKISKKLRQKYGFDDPEKKFTYYTPYWASFNALKSHLLKNNQSIELISE